MAKNRDMGIQTAFFGVLSHDAERREAKGKEFVKMSVRVVDGDETHWIDVTSYDYEALERIDDYVVGSPIFCRGKLGAIPRKDQHGVIQPGFTLVTLDSKLAFRANLAFRGNKKGQKTTNTPSADPAGRPAPATMAGTDDLNNATSL